MNKASVIILLSVFLVGLGFNTLDAMVWGFYWSRWSDWCGHLWSWTPTIKFDVWFSYFFGGIVPFGVGMILLGYLIANTYMLNGHTNKDVKTSKQEVDDVG